MTLPFGPMQAERDAAMRASKAAGRNVIDAGEAHLQGMWDDMRMVHVPGLVRPTYTHSVLSFGYDPADDADDWWMSWGQLRDAPNAPKRALQEKTPELHVVPHIALDRRTNTGHSHAALLTQLKLKTHSLHRWALSGRVPYDSTAVPFPASHRAQLYHRPGSLIAT
ncbi:hypothetical protein C8F04DRAFT_1261119 [Mycena alexandri]|uniref:Uncharacterized protein n=1 Tax=Mycena alexandri TaxID=1745969 RepID=A0AAD6WZI5_9AGAR|nr:hypothetical protein C8F04DRAFT_1261119 [Mycena alexandri]